ncbi:DNA invertase Pin-like site-specific DNA recombinase [Flavobacterium sp. 2755]|uniref:recombinase family protein n=1 Tax=Flavobacterium sp. 2755 TaxID=2817765 RepID=UPI002857256A|nr:recombinase family protein [Flavobacterium sp. 2755]MDR6761822.1 DNA invertase Pin-like site-specific DNA recombinase [Flavobacterium sp. 2755]
MKAVAYLRVSTQEQSLERQYDDIYEFASKKNLQLVKMFEDKISATKTKTDERFGFNEMKRYLELNEDVRNILVLEISRLGRKNNDIQNVVEDYTEKGINIHIKDLNISTLDDYGQRSFASEMMISMLGVMSSNETRLLSSRISSGKMSRARKNLAFGGKIIGYKKGENGTPIIDETEAPMIRRIFELASKNLGMRNISTLIESEFKRKIAIGTLSGIIRNSFHKGERKYIDLQLPVPEIVSKELWKKANDSINNRSKFGSRTNVNPNILQGKITCECGNVMHQKVIPQGRIDSFICKDEKCKNSINRPWLFRMTRKIVERHAQKTKDEQVRENYKLQMSSHKIKIELNSKEIDKLENKLQRARNLYIDLDLSKEEYNATKAEISTKIEHYNQANKKLTEFIITSENALKTDIKHFSEDLNLFKNEIKDIIEEVIINKEMVAINIYGWTPYCLDKPNPIKLGWEARKPVQERYLEEKLPIRHPFSKDDLELMVDDYLKIHPTA